MLAGNTDHKLMIKFLHFNSLDQWQATKQHRNESNSLYTILTSTKAKSKMKGEGSSESIRTKTEIEN